MCSENFKHESGPGPMDSAQGLGALPVRVSTGSSCSYKLLLDLRGGGGSLGNNRYRCLEDVNPLGDSDAVATNLRG